MFNNLSADLRNLNEPHLFKNLSDQLIELDKQEYDDEKYKDNIKRYYLGNYDLP
jgi:hypothetical protein